MLTVREIEASHDTSVMVSNSAGKFHSELFPYVDMCFCRGDESHHHDLALVQSPDPSTQSRAQPFDMFGNRVGVNHLAISYPDREAWLAKLAEIQAKEVRVVFRVNHGMTHSCYVGDPDGNGVELLYDLPRRSGSATSTPSSATSSWSRASGSSRTTPTTRCSRE